jgi:hypothetical protein
MSVKITRHILDKQRGLEIVDIEDSHGRKHQIQVPILMHPDPDKFIAQEIAEFETAEAAITKHIAERFDPETLERLK